MQNEILLFRRSIAALYAYHFQVRVRARIGLDPDPSPTTLALSLHITRALIPTPRAYLNTGDPVRVHSHDLTRLHALPPHSRRAQG